MAWIEVHQSLPRHRKLIDLARLLDIQRTSAAGHVVFFWLWALDNIPDGNLTGVSPGTIAIAAEWDGDANVFYAALVEARFIEDDAQEARIHDWHDYAGRLIERRKADAERKKRMRGNMSAGRPQDVRGMSAATVPNPTVPNPTTREEGEQTRALSSWEVPAWFIPLTKLPGYKARNHSSAAENIRRSCVEADASVTAVVEHFAEQFPLLRHSYAWSDPVATLKGKPLMIAIRDVKDKQSKRKQPPVATAADLLARRE